MCICINIWKHQMQVNNQDLFRVKIQAQNFLPSLLFVDTVGRNSKKRLKIPSKLFVNNTIY